jgi:phage baseplate assembly protein W
MANDKPATNFLGTGWSYPPTFRKAVRGVSMTTGEEDIDRSLEILVSTALGERVMLPEYGSNLEELLFEPMDTGLQTLIFDRINTAVLYYEPRIEVEELIVSDERIVEGVLLIKMDYRVRATNSRYNFVYPFYINEGSEINTP